MQFTPVNFIFQGFATTAQNRIHFENFILKSIDLQDNITTILNFHENIDIYKSKMPRLKDKIEGGTQNIKSTILGYHLYFIVNIILCLDRLK